MRTRSLVRVYITRDHRALYLVDVIQSVTLVTNPLWPESRTAALLYLHGIVNNSLATPVAGTLASDS